MCDNNMIQHILREMTKKYKEIYGDSLKSIKLYGSYARGDYNQYSDIDIVAIAEGERLELLKKFYDIFDIVGELSLEYEIVIQPAIIPLKEFEKYKEALPYYKNIENEGVELIA